MDQARFALLGALTEKRDVFEVRVNQLSREQASYNNSQAFVLVIDLNKLEAKWGYAKRLRNTRRGS